MPCTELPTTAFVEVLYEFAPKDDAEFREWIRDRQYGVDIGQGEVLVKLLVKRDGYDDLWGTQVIIRPGDVLLWRDGRLIDVAGRESWDKRTPPVKPMDIWHPVVRDPSLPAHMKG